MEIKVPLPAKNKRKAVISKPSTVALCIFQSPMTLAFVVARENARPYSYFLQDVITVAVTKEINNNATCGF